MSGTSMSRQSPRLQESSHKCRTIRANPSGRRLDVAAKVPVIGGHLASDDELRDWLQHPQRAAQLTVGYEVHPRPVAVGFERPRSVDWVRPLDDVHADAHGPVELGELD